MPRLALTGGAYQARSVIASAQRSLNLYQEPMPQQQGEPSQFASYPTPGLTLIGQMPQGPIRCIRQATNDGVYIAAGSGIYHVTGSNPLTFTLLGSITSGLTTPVSMQDNSETLVIVDGSTNGWQVDLASNTFSAISDPSGMFAGADRVDYLDTYLLFNKPGTPQFYSSDSLAVTFDTLYFANKSSYPDNLVLAVVAKREIWLIGERTTEVWYNAGTTDFPFGQIPATFVDHGCIAKYSAAVYDNSVFWLTLDRQGGPLLMQGAGYQTKRVSTYALEQAWVDYPTVSDAIGFVYLIGGHAIYVLTFPTADHTWCYDISTQLWHEWLWIDSGGTEHRSRCNCAYPLTTGGVYAGDWQNGNIYQLDHNNQTDNGQPIKRQRSWPHVLNDGKRVFHRQFAADFETGMGGPAPSAPQQLINCMFNGPDGTPVEQYAPPLPELNTTWTRIDGAGAQLQSGAAVAINANTRYANAAFPPAADYSIAFRVLPNPQGMANGSSAMVGARSLAMPTQMSGYWGGIQIYNGGWFAQLMGGQTSLGNLVPIGQPAPDGWFNCLMTVVGTAMTLTVQRSQDGLYVAPTGQWQSTPVAAISITDGIYIQPGRIMFGLNSVATGVMGTEDAAGTWVLEDGSGFSWEWDEAAGASLCIDNIVAITVPSPWLLYLDWSDDRGHTYGNPVGQSMGGQGEYLTQAQYQRLGYSRDRVYRLTFTAPIRTAIQGAWIDATPAQS